MQNFVRVARLNSSNNNFRGHNNLHGNQSISYGQNSWNQNRYSGSYNDEEDEDDFGDPYTGGNSDRLGYGDEDEDEDDFGDPDYFGYEDEDVDDCGDNYARDYSNRYHNDYDDDDYDQDIESY